MAIKKRIASIIAGAVLATAATYTISPPAEEKLVQFEGEKLVAYKDIVGIPTIGVGTIYQVEMRDKITKEESRLLLKDDLRSSSKAIERNVKIPITSQPQVDALLHWLHNFGEKNFKASTLLVKINNNDCIGAAKEFLRWDKVKKVDAQTKNTILVVNKHQKERRQYEHDLWLKGCEK